MSKLVEHHSRWSGLGSEDSDAEIAVLGVPFDNAVSWRGGARHAPERIRSITPHLAFSTEEGTLLSIRVKDYGDVEPDLDWVSFFDTTEVMAADIINSQHKLPIFLGGDHSVGIPLFKAFAKSFQGRLAIFSSTPMPI
jgi:agmatinase